MSMDSMHVMRSVWAMGRRDSSVVDKQIPPGTWKRIMRFARPYRLDLLVFLVVIVIDALIGVATPVLAGKVVNEITRHGEIRVVVKIAIVIVIDPDGGAESTPRGRGWKWFAGTANSGDSR